MPRRFNKGQSIDFKVQTDATSFRIDVYRIGYYGGNGARLITTLGTFSGPTNQPSPSDLPPIDPTTHCVFEDTTALIDCGNWNTTTTWSVPSNAVSGVYIAKLVRLSPPPVVVRLSGGNRSLQEQRRCRASRAVVFQRDARSSQR